MPLPVNYYRTNIFVKAVLNAVGPDKVKPLKMVSKIIPNFPTGRGEGGGSQYAIYTIIFIEPRGEFGGIRHSRELRAES